MRISTNLQENFPFISVINHVNHEYVGIIINQDAQVTSIYDYSSIRTDLEKQQFIELGETWWWESNRQIPINIFLAKELAIFRYVVKTFATKAWLFIKYYSSVSGLVQTSFIISVQVRPIKCLLAGRIMARTAANCSTEVGQHCLRIAPWPFK